MEVWIGRDGERHGPYNEDDVRQWLRSGQVSREDLGWYEGLADWQPLSVLFPDAAVSPPAAAPPVTPTPTMPLPQTTTASLEDYAGFWKRLAAWILDYLILLIPVTIIAVTTGVTTAFEHLLTQLQSGADQTLAFAEYVQAARPATMVALVVGYIYYVIFECSKWQATPGKMALGLRVTDIHGQPLSIGRCLIRNAVRLLNAVTVLIPLICYLTTAWTSRKQGFHDMVARALVLNGRASEFKSIAAPSGNNDSFSA